MKCKLCHKNVRNIGHWAREHKKWLRSRPRKARRTHAKGQNSRRSRKTASSTSGHYCPVCGKMH